MTESVIADYLQRGAGRCEAPDETFTVVPEQEEETHVGIRPSRVTCESGFECAWFHANLSGTADDSVSKQVVL